MNPTACLIIIGNEILSGRTQDKNLNHLALTLNERGIELREARVVPDIEDDIVKAVNETRAKHTYVFTTGGIGPTHDDITSASVAKAFGVPLYRHPDAVAALTSHYATDQINEARLKMADVPEGSILIANEISTAPGFCIGNVFVMAGIPNIMQAMLRALLPMLQEGSKVASLSVSTNLTEGIIAADLTAIQNRYPSVDIGSYPHHSNGKHTTTLVCRSTNTKDNQSAHDAIKAMITALGGTVVDAPTTPA